MTLTSFLKTNTQQNTPAVEFHPGIRVQHSYSAVGMRGGRTHVARATIAFTVKDGILTYSTAYCSPNDQFVRKVGYQITTGRLAAQVSKSEPLPSWVTPEDLSSYVWQVTWSKENMPKSWKSL